MNKSSEMSKSGVTNMLAYRFYFAVSPFLFLAILILVLLVSPLNLAQPVSAQSERHYKAALPGYKYSFPADHFSHDQFKTEWWYYTGHLKSEDGRRFGFELTFFRNGADKEPLNKKNAWALENFYMAHFAVTDESGKTFRFYEKLNRKALGLADARQDAYYVFNEGWSVEKLGEHYLLRAGAKDYSIHLLLKSAKPPVIHGVNGVSQKASCAGCASHYYSMTRMSAEGNIFIGEKPLAVTGQVWMDHEFGSNQLTGDQVGWDWFSMQLADNREVMLYMMRRADGTLEKESSGTVVYPDGKSKHLRLGDFTVSKLSTWKSPKSGGVYPSGWQVQIPSEALTLTLKPILVDQELKTERSTGVSYWEGAVEIAGKSKDKPVSGEGYVEMTGYAEKFNKKL